MLRTILLALLIATLCACQTTVLEHLPQGARSECPADVLGAWIAVEDDGQDTPDFGLLVHKDCTLESRDKDGSAHPAHSPLPHAQFFSSAGKDLVFIPMTEAFELAAVKPDDKANARAKTGCMVFAWRRYGNELALQAPDHRHVAHLIVDGVVSGRTAWSDDDRIIWAENVLRGDETAMAQLLAHTDLFGDTKSMRLRHVGNDEKALNRALRAATSKAKPIPDRK